MRYLAIDLGQRRTGLAIGDDDTRIATPLEVVRAADEAGRLAAVARAIEDHHPDALVLGLALNMDDSEGPAVTAARAFAALLTQRFALEVHLVDERLTTVAADEQMAGHGLTRGQKKKRRDALAAAVILNDFLNRSPGEDRAS